MINYTSQNQLSLELFEHPFEEHLDPENRWVKMAEIIPWDDLAAVYASKLQSDSGRYSVNIRTVIAALIIKHYLGLDDRGTIEMIKENIYMQYFCGLKTFTKKKVFDPSLFVDIRKRMGGEEFDKFNRLIIKSSEKRKPHQSSIMSKGVKNKNNGTKNTSDGSSKSSDKEEEHKGQKGQVSNRGTLKLDATVADQEIKFPNDVSLLNSARENLERIIDNLYNAMKDISKPRDYRRVARKAYLGFSKKRRKSAKTIRKAIKVQLQFVRRDLKITDMLLSKAGNDNLLSGRDIELLKTIRKMYEQQKWMYDNKTHSCPERIVSIYQPWVRPIVRGKDKNKTEFGAKINVSEVNGFCRINTFKWEAYNEGGDLPAQVESFRELYGCYPKVLLADKIYLTRENRLFLKEKGIAIYGKPLGRPPAKPKETAQQRYRERKKAAERNHIEGKFGQGKRGYGLNNIKARLPETSESWINAIFFVMNLTKLLQIAEKYPDFFVPVLDWINFRLKRIEKRFQKYFFKADPHFLLNLAW